MKKILLTGASGFIGRQSIPFLLKNKYEVHAIYCRTAPDAAQARQCLWHKCDLFNSDQQKSLLAKIKPTHLLHFAWDTTPGEYWTSYDNFRWVQASLELLINFHNVEGRRAVLAGSCAEYDWSDDHCSEKTTPLRPATLYGTCKNSLQEMTKFLCQKAEISWAWGRIFYTFGPYESPSRFIPSVITAMINNQKTECTHGKQKRDFLYVEDTAAAFVQLLESEASGPVNIGSGKEVSLADIVHKIADILDKKSLVQLGTRPTALNDPPQLVADIRRLSQEVKWKPGYSLEAGLQKTIQWWKENKQKGWTKA